MSSIKEECLFGKLDFQGNNRRLLLNKPELLRAINNAVESNSLPSLREQIYQLTERIGNLKNDAFVLVQRELDKVPFRLSYFSCLRQSVFLGIGRL